MKKSFNYCLVFTLIFSIFMINVNAKENETKPIEYLAMSELAYCWCGDSPDNTNGNTNYYIGKKIGETDIIDNCIANKSNDVVNHKNLSISEKQFTLEILNLTKEWTLINVYRGSGSGFYAISLEKDDERVLAFRGSQDFFNKYNLETDWTDNLIYGFTNQQSPQMEEAIKTIDIDMKTVSDKKYSTTGHSLGGGLAVFAANYAGVYGYGFDGSPTTDVSYYKIPEKMSKKFKGIDDWKSVDYVNQHCPVGNIEINCKNHVVVEDKNAGFIHGLGVYTIGMALVSHNRWAMVDKFAGTYSLSPTIREKYYEIYDQLVKHPLMNRGKVVLGSSGSETISYSLVDSIVAYGGAGNDKIYGTFFDDTIIGGPGNDNLDGKEGNDTYIYWKGQGLDIINDIAGNDTLKLYGFDSTDNVTINVGDDHIGVNYNGESIAIINKKRNSIFKNSFTVVLFDKDYKFIRKEVVDNTGFITNIFRSYVVACPTKVNIYDRNENLVLTLNEELSEPIYNDYGNFYVSNENGELVKHFSLNEGYTFKIVATDDGSMDFYKIESDKGNVVINKATNIPITKNETFELQKNEDIIELHGDNNQTIELVESTNESFAEIKSVDDVTIEKGDNYLLNVSVVPTIDKVTYTSSDTSIATVDSNGNITAVEVGECKITASSESGATKEINVTIKNKEISGEINCIDNVTIEKGSNYSLEVSVVPATDKVTYTSSDTSIATVDSNGNITAVEVGECKITVSTESGVSKEINVTIKLPEQPLGEINCVDNVSIEKGASYSLKVSVTPTVDKITYNSSNTSIAKVDSNGKITAVGIGECKITVSTENGLSKDIKVTVKKVSAPKKTSISKTTAKKKALKVTWKKTSGVKGYQIEYSLKKNYKGSKKVTITKQSTTSKTISKLKRRKKYYVRVRTYREVGGKKYYSGWSKTVTKKTK